MFPFSFLAFMLGLSLILLSQGGNEYQIFYRYPGSEQKIALELDSAGTVADAIQRIRRERTIAKGYEMKMSLKGDVLLDTQSLADACIGADTVVDIIIIQLTPAHQILNAFMNTNFREILRLGENEQNCSDWQSFVKCNDTTGNPIEISIFNKLELEGIADLSLLPDTIERINIVNTNLNGTVDLMNLPRNLNKFQFTGSDFIIDLSRMNRDRWPQHLEEIFLRNSKYIFGRLDCSQLPRSLLRLEISELNLDIVFNDLPPQMIFMSISFSTVNELDLSNPLPESSKVIAIHNTKIFGEIKLQGIRNRTSLEILTYNTEMVEKIEVAARDSVVNVKESGPLLTLFRRSSTI